LRQLADELSSADLISEGKSVVAPFVSRLGKWEFEDYKEFEGYEP
jgi:hypothetical protein